MSKKPCRFVNGLVLAEPCDRPACIPKVRKLRGRKAAGINYETNLAGSIRLGLTGVLPLWHGQWFRFIDRNGGGFCQPDILLKTEVGTAILESKYTWTPAGHLQLEKLYIPVVEKAWPGVPAFGLVVCKVLTPDVDRAWICRDLRSAIARSSAGLKTVLHWTGAGLGPLQIAA